MGEEERIRRLLGTFYRATQIEAIYFDRQMNLIACGFGEHTGEDFTRISMGRAERFLETLFSKEPDASDRFYTYYLNRNFFCNICLLMKADACLGAVVTQPASLSPQKRAEIEAGPECAALDPGERPAYVSALLRAPVLPHDRVMPVGELLDLLVQSAFEARSPYQVVCGGETQPALFQPILPERHFHLKRSSSPEDRHCGHAAYLAIKDAVSKGNTEALQEAFDALAARNVQMDQHASKDILRSIKNRMIEGCAMCGFFAIEAGVPYEKTRAFSEDLISALEETDNVSELYALMKSGLKTLTRYAALTRISGYSKHVRLALEYIERHYAERITLEALAREVNLSEFYLSAIIKKETGSSVTDIISRVRVEESKRILSKSTVSITELASMVGYTYSNHFSRVFKQHTGMTPSEYARTMSGAADGDARSRELLYALTDQLRQAMEAFPGVFDAGRIVDPASNLSWSIQPGGRLHESVCYHFWTRKQSCETCISRMALEQNRPIVKLDQGDCAPCLVFAAPAALAEKKFVVELLKSVGDNYIDCTKSPKPSRD